MHMDGEGGAVPPSMQMQADGVGGVGALVEPESGNRVTCITIIDILILHIHTNNVYTYLLGTGMSDTYISSNSLKVGVIYMYHNNRHNYGPYIH
jgi:hypothetical protein